MDLAAYLRATAQTYTQFASKIGTKHARTVERYAKGQRRPNKAMRAAIALATSGDVPVDVWDQKPVVVACGNCGLHVDRPEVRTCSRSDCPLSVQEAA